MKRFAPSMFFAFLAIVAGFPESPGFRSAVQSLRTQEAPGLTLKMINDSMGIGVLEDWDDLYTFGAGVRYAGGPWALTFDYTALTDRNLPPEEPLRIDGLGLRAGYRPIDGLELYAEGNLYGSFGGEFVQNNWHRLLGIPRMGPYGYENWSGADFSVGAGFSKVLFDTREMLPGVRVLADAAAGLLAPYRLQGALLLFWGDADGNASLLGGYRTEHTGRESRVLASAAEMNRGWWLSFSVMSGPLAVINSCDPETGSLDYSIELDVLSSGDPRDGRGSPFVRTGLGPFLDRVALDTVLLFPPMPDFADGRVSFGFSWQDGNDRTPGTGGTTTHFQRFFVAAEADLFAPADRPAFLPFLRAGLGMENRITAQPTMHRIRPETETTVPAFLAGTGVRFAVPDGLPSFLPRELELAIDLHLAFNANGIGADVSPRFLFWFY